MPSVDAFLYFFEAKSPGKKLWMRFNGVAERVLLTLFQQSYKGFKGKFFKICYNKHDPTLLDGFALYWVEKPGLKRPRSLEDLARPDREMCQLLSSLGMVFNTAEMIKLEYSPKHLKGYIGILFDSAHFTCILCWFTSYALLFSCVDMVLNAEKRRMLAEATSKLKAGVGLSDAKAAAPVDAPSTPIPTPSPSAPAPADLRLKGVVKATAPEDEDTCFGLVFKRKKGADAAVPAQSASDGRASFF